MGSEIQYTPETSTKKSKKKRKRDRENGDEGKAQQETSKEFAEQQPVNVKIELINDHGKTPPIVGYFPSGYKVHNNDNVEEPGREDELSPLLVSPDVKFYRNAQRNKVEKSDKWTSSERMELVVSPRGSNVEFVGKNYRGEAEAAQLCTYALGVFDKNSQTLKIMPIAGNKIFRLEPQIHGLHTSNKEPETVENEELPAETRQDKMSSLTASYGTKKARDQIRKTKLMQVGDDTGPLGDNAVINKDALNSANIHDVRNIPPHNTNATTPQEAYPLDKIIMMGEWDYLLDVHQDLQVGSEVASGAYPTFVLNRIHKLRAIQNEEQKHTISGVLSFITHLIKFKDVHSLDGRSSAKNHKFPNILKQRFAQLFDSTSRVLALEKIDLLISYVLVLTLYADDFKTDPSDIAKDLKISPVNLRVHFENLGCKFVRENKVLLATLPVPLTFPSLRRRRRR